MALDYLGSVSIGTVFPVGLSLIATSLAELNGKLAGLLQVQAALTVQPPTLNATAVAAAKALAEVQASISLGLPGATLQLSAAAAIIAGLEAQIAAVVAIQANLVGASVHAYVYTGQANGIGPALTAAATGGFPGGGPFDPVGGLIIVATTPAARAALSATCGISV